MKNRELQNRLQQIISLVQECQSLLGELKSIKLNYPVSLQKKRSVANVKMEKVNFNLNSRAFFKKYAKDMSGAKRFVLVVAYLSKTKTDSSISSDEVKNCWNKHKKLLGGKLAMVYGTRAKEGGWLDAVKYGYYNLTSDWREIFK